MDPRSAFFGMAGISVAGAALALASAAVRTPEPAAPSRGAEAVEATSHVGPTSVDQEQDDALDSGSASPHNAYRKGTELLESFFWQRFPVESDAAGSWSVLADSSLVQDPRCSPDADPPCVRWQDNFDALVAILPDPYYSHLDWTYDASLEAIRRAFEKAGFVADRHWIPGRDETLRIGTPSGEAMVSRRERHPGVILFRHTDLEPVRIRLLYLVGEIPTGGIHKGALDEALRERRSILQGIGRGPTAGRCPADVPLQQENEIPAVAAVSANTVRIIGPTFSGSASSLLRVLNSWVEPTDSAFDTRACVVSGSATSFPHRPADTGRIHFQATVNPDARLDFLLRDSVLLPLRATGSHVALLTEMSTAYGQSITGSGSAPVGTGVAGGLPADAGGNSEAENSAPFVDVPFPLNIASVRAGYERNPDDWAPTDIMLSGRAASRLPLSMQDAGRQRENPLITSRLTPPVLDLSLEEIMRALMRHDIRAVGIQATDVRDKLFLGELVRRRMGDVQLFTFESSSLFLRTEFNPALRGMLVLSSYPLFLENQWWPQAGRDSTTSRIHFASDGVQGVHNATLIQVDRGDLAVEYGIPFGTSTSEVTRPPVWLTVVGSRSFLPIRMFATPDSLSYVAAVAAIHGQGGTQGKDPHREALLAVGSIVLFGAGLLLASLVIIRLGVEDIRADRKRRARQDRRRSRGRRRSDPVLGSRPATAGGALVQAVATDPHPTLTAEPGAAITLDAARIPIPWNVTGLRVRLATLPARIRLLPARAPEYAAFLDVQHGSLLIHRSLYAVLLLVALGSVIAPPALVLGYAEANSIARHGIQNYLLGSAVLLVLVAWLLAVGLAAARGGYHLLRMGRRGLAYSLGWQWWRSAKGWLWHAEWIGRMLVLAAGAAYAYLVVRYLGDIRALTTGGLVPFEVFAHRAVQIESGVSPLLPLMLTGLGFAVWSGWHLQRIQLLLDTTVFERICLTRQKPPKARRRATDPASCNLTVRLAENVKLVRERLFLVVPHATGLLLVVVMAALGTWLLGRFGHTFEALIMPSLAGSLTAFDLLFRFSVLATLAATTWAVYRLILTWSALQQCLCNIAETPLASAFERLPHRISALTRLSLLGGTADHRLRGAGEAEAVASTSATHWHYLARIFESGRENIQQELASDPALFARMDRLSKGPPLPVGRQPEDQLNGLHHVLADLWSRQPTAHDLGAVAPGYGKADAAERLAAIGIGRHVRRTFAGPEGLWLRVAEELAAIKFVDYVEWVLRHFRRLALFLLLSLLITTVLLSSYPFQPQSLAKMVFLFVLLGTVGALTYVMVQMNRDEVLSRITGTDPGRITWNTTFILNMALFAVLPLLALISSEFAGLRSFLFSWLDPLLRQLTSM